MVRNLTNGLLLRSGVFYFRMDMKISRNRYKSIRRSLHTTNLYTAIQRLNQMKNFINTFSKLSQEEQKEFIKFYTGGEETLTEEEQKELENGDTSSIICAALDVWMAQRLDSDKLAEIFAKKSYEFDIADTGFPDTAAERVKAKRKAAEDLVNAKYMMSIREKLNPAEAQEYEDTLEMINGSKLRDRSWEEYQARKAGKFAPTVIYAAQPQQSYQKQQNKHTIDEIMQYMFEVSQIKSQTQISQKYDIKNMIASVNLSLDDDYSKMNDPDVIKQICKWIKERQKKDGANISNKRKNKQLGILRSLIQAANRKEPAQYKLTELIEPILFLRKETKGQTKEYWPFSETQLANMFDPKHDFFKKNPEQFLACLIALFSGARTNAAVSLQFKDITTEFDIYCMAFYENHERKHLKNDATERFVPIAKQLIDWGGVDMIKARQKKIGAKDTDFIFARTQHELSGDPADKFMTPFLRFIRQKLKITSTDRKIYAFHSFRDTVSNKMADCGIDDTMAKKLVGWKGGDTRYTHYTKRDCQEQQAAIDKLVYPEDILHLEEWKKIIPDLYINPEKISHSRGKYKPHIKID